MTGLSLVLFHVPVKMELRVGEKKSLTQRRPTRVIGWNKYKEIAEGIQGSPDEAQIAQLVCIATERATECRNVVVDIPDLDMHVLSLWERRLVRSLCTGKTKARETSNNPTS